MVSVIFPWRETSDDRKASFQFVKNWYASVLGSHEWVVADDIGNEGFNRGRALNQGVKYATQDILVFADTDLIVDPSALLGAIEIVKTKPEVGFVVPFSRVAYMDQKHTKLILEGAKPDEHYPGTTYWKQPSTGGLNVLTRESFEKSRGFDPRFKSWGFEDSAWDAQMQCLVGPTQWVGGPAYHLYHPSARNGAAPGFQAARQLCDRYRLAIKNPEEMNKIIAERS